jgi:hypothetical protein
MLNHAKSDCVDVCPPVRNRYFYGKMLDVFHFELEQQYFNSKRWLLNRLVSGYGVLCGLNVQLGSDNQSIIVTPGIAIDKCGHEIFVCEPSEPQPLCAPPPAPTPPTGGTPPPGVPAGTVPHPRTTTYNSPNAPSTTPNQPVGNGSPQGTNGWDCGKFVHVSLCYQECPSDPMPAMGGDCDTQSICSPGAIRERYKIEICEGKLTPARTTSRITDIVVGELVNYAALANYVTSLGCQSAYPECCIPLANIRIPDPGQTYNSNSIDISVRPICYTNDLLYEMILAMQPGQSQAVAGKP